MVERLGKGTYQTQTRVVGLCEDRMGWFEDELGEEDGLLALVNQKAAHL